MDASTSVDLYAATRERITAAGHAFSVEQFDRRVPACPGWTVHNLISHLAGVAADFISGNLDGAPRPSWTAVQVDKRRDLSTTAVLNEWAETGPTLEKLVLSGTTSHPCIP